MSNEIGTKKTENNAVLDRTMPNPFPGTEGAVEEQEAALIATDGRPDAYAQAEEDALPEWFDPTNFALTTGLGFSLYKITTKRTIASAPEGETSIFLIDSGIGDSAEAAQIATKVSVAYRPFVFNKISLGILAGYQAIPSIGSHDLQAGLSFAAHSDTGLSLGMNAYYAHTWVKDIELTHVGGPATQGEPIPEEILLDMVPDALSLDGIGLELSVNYSLTDYFELGAFINMNYYASSDSSMSCTTPGVQAVVNF
jgi:hypothetical protein